MTEYAWFKLLVRGIGILLLGLSIPSLVTQVWWIITHLVSDSPRSLLEILSSVLGGLAYSLVQAAIGTYLLIGAEGLIRHCLRGLSDRCLGCGYPLAGLNAAACPECGLSLTRPVQGPQRGPGAADETTAP
jgi:hypothetical protein